MNSKRINPFGDDDDEDFANAWGSAPPPSATTADESGISGLSLGASSNNILKDTIKKEAAINDIMASQGDLRTLLDRIKYVQSEVDKLEAGNATLEMYADNLAKQAAKR